MMHPEKCRVMWSNYSDHLKSMMKELMMNQDFSDVTLVTEDKKQLKANVNILSACSPVFKDIFKKEKNLSTIMYLRGIKFSEMESIMQFIYLGEATFYEERMDEFLAVAKSLEIKELCNTENESNDEPDNETTLSDPVTLPETLEETILSDHSKMQIPQESERGVLHECEYCHKHFSHRASLHIHKKSVHEGVKFACDQCDYQATTQGNLSKHIRSKHEGVKYYCDQCEYQATQQGNLTQHIQTKHEGAKYACDQCDHQFTHPSTLNAHIKKKHKSS